MLLLSILITWASFVVGDEIVTKFEWKYIDYTWKNKADKQCAIDEGVYNHTKIHTFDFEATKDGRWFVTCPKFDYTNPASLSTICNSRGDGGPLLRPYPSWDWHNQDDCSGITNVITVTSDHCGRVWVVDSGIVANKQVCPAKILAFDLVTDKLVTEYKIPKSVQKGGLLEIHFVEKQCDCRKPWVYITDLWAGGIIVFDGSSIWRHDFDVLDSPKGTCSEGRKITPTARNLGLGVMSPMPSQSYVFLRSMESKAPYLTTLKDLHASKYQDFKLYATDHRHPDVSWNCGFSKAGVGFSSFMKDSTLSCWYIKYPLQNKHIHTLRKDCERFNTVSSIQMAEDKNGDDILYMMSNSYMKFVQKKMDCSRVNFRIMAASVHELVKGTPCEPSSKQVQPTAKELGFYPWNPSKQCPA